MRTTVHNLHAERMRPGDVYCGRAGHGQDGYFGNPYSLREHGEAALTQYADHLLERVFSDADFRARAALLYGKRLFCFCSSPDKPRRCHVHLLAAAVEWLTLYWTAVSGGEGLADGYRGDLRGVLDGVLGVWGAVVPGEGVLRVVTLWRPWDFAITQLAEDVAKRVENRTRAAPYRCPWYMAVRGGQMWDDVWEDWVPAEARWPAGYVSGVAEVVAHDAPGTGPESAWRNPEAWGWRLGRVAQLPSQVLWPPPKDSRHPEDKRSMQGFVELKPELYGYDAELLAVLRSTWGAKYGRNA